MKALLQRVVRGSVTIEGRLRGQIDRGLVILAGVGNDDDRSDAELLADKIVNLRIFEDEAGKFNLSALDVGAELLAISQFTLFADTRRGRRPGFTDAAPPDISRPLFDYFVECLCRSGLKTATGEFSAHMVVEIINDGPVTIMLDSKERQKK